MNTKQAVAAAAFSLLGASAAFAQTPTLDLQFFGQDQVSTQSRAAVRAEVQSAVASGELTVPDEVLAAAVPVRAAGAPRVTRAQVQAELATADLQTPDEVVAWEAGGASSRNRADVRVEARAQARVDRFQEPGRIGAGY